MCVDLMMTGMHGLRVMEEFKRHDADGYLPVLVITAQPDHKLRSLDVGAKDFISKPFELSEVLVRVRNMLEVRLLHEELRQANELLEERVKERTSDLQESYLQTIFTMTRAAEHKDEDTGAHVQRISYYSRDLARILGLGDTYIDMLFFSSPMHDIGKIGVPDHILLKPGGFTPGEQEIMKGHAAMGAKILGNSKSPFLQMAAEIALNHHEQWSGGGYPNGKRGTAIPRAARIMTICDVYDALRSKRPYKAPFDHEKTMDILRHGDARTHPEHFDPIMLEAFMDNHAIFEGIFSAHAI